MNTYREDTLIKYIGMLPPELVRYIKQYLPITLLKKLRRIHDIEFPLNYRLCKEMNDYFYQKYIGFNMDISSIKMNIKRLQTKKIQNKSTVFNPFSVNFWTTEFTNDTSIDNEISRQEKNIELFQIIMNYYQDYYNHNVIQLRNYNIIDAV